MCQLISQRKNTTNNPNDVRSLFRVLCSGSSLHLAENDKTLQIVVKTKQSCQELELN